MRFDVGKHRCKRLFDALFDRYGVQAVQAQKALDELVVAQAIEDRVRTLAELVVNDRKHALERFAVESDDRSSELLGCSRARRGVASAPMPASSSSTRLPLPKGWRPFRA